MSDSTFLETNNRATFTQGETRNTNVTAVNSADAKKSTQSVGERVETTAAGSSTVVAATTGTDKTITSSTAGARTSQSTTHHQGDVAVTISFRMLLTGGLGSPLPTDPVVAPCE